MKEVFLFAVALAAVINLIKADDNTFIPSASKDQNSKNSSKFSIEFDEESNYEIDGISGSSDFQTLTECPIDPVPGSTAVKLPHESECNLYYTCENGEKILSECDEGLFYNPLLQMCDWAPPAGCTVTEKPTEKPTTKPPTDPTTCPSEDPEDPVLLPHECICSQYYLCRKGEQILQKCLADEGFNSKLGKCTAFEYSDCVKDDPGEGESEEGDSPETPPTSRPIEPTEPTSPPTEPTEPTLPPTKPTKPTSPPTEPTPPPTKPTKPTRPPTKPTKPTSPPTEPTPPPTKPTKPTSPPTEPTEPTSPPTEPTEPTPPPTKPTEPTSPPTEPTEPTPPPTKPTKPTSPPTEPTEPTPPPTKPTKPTSHPTEPTEPTPPPTKPTKPTSPPTEPTEPTPPPTKPTKPTSPPTEPTKPTPPSTKPTKPTSPPTEPTEPTPPPTKPTKPTSPPTEPTEPTPPPTEPTEPTPPPTKPTNPTSPPSESTTNKWESAESCIGTCPIRDPIEYTVLLEHKDCSRFCKCSNGTPYVYKCPTNLEFSPTLKVCTYPADAGCKYKSKNENMIIPSVVEPSFFQNFFH